MKDETTSMKLKPISRRTLIGIAGSSLIVAACSDNAATGRRQFVLISDAELAALGQEAWRDALQRLPRVDDAAMQRRLSRIGQKIAEVSPTATDHDWEFVVFDAPEINAFVLPGGKVGFFRGLIDEARSDDEIAAVMGHEIGHVEARHAAERMSQQAALELGVSIAAAALSEEYGRNAETIAGALGAGALYGVILPYSRMQELEADRLGVRLMTSAGYDPSGALLFWRRMASDGAGALEWMSTHPADARRLAELEALVGQRETQ
ncbi:Zn-dependent protease with chaperone function [alpha proteobacterium U9-1i]|nr:Zn-dependent protease with chaperone function [alpha proteobacterium U9-1i]